MAGAVPRFVSGPITYQAYQAIAGGQLVAPGTAGNAALVGVCGANAINCLGVATTDALPAGTAFAGTINGFPSVDTSVPDENVAVGRTGVWKLNAAGTIAFGDFVKPAAAGAVVKWVDGTDTPATKIGQCTGTAGGTNGGTVEVQLNFG